MYIFTNLLQSLIIITLHHANGSQQAYGGVGRADLTHFAWLGEFCEQNSDCQPELSECNQVTKACTCSQYSVEANATTCLRGKYFIIILVTKSSL